MHWWQLPGPARFISELVNDLRDGRNVIVQLPKFTPEGLERAVRAGVGDDLIWQDLEILSPSQLTPAQTVFNRVIQRELQRGLARNTQALLNHPSFGGTIISLKNMTPHVWPTWREFLLEYEHGCRNISMLDRSLFLCFLEGGFDYQIPAPDICLSIRKWNNFVDPLDMLIYTTGLFSGTNLPPLKKKLAISVSCNLAVFDPEVSERLSRERLETIVTPEPVLRQMAKRRNWEVRTVEEPSVTWTEGMTHCVGGEDFVHSAVLCIKDPNQELKKRIWSAEVGTMVPFVEERRREILENYRKFFKLPHITSDGEILTDANQLEIGHIYSQVMNGIRLDIKTIEKIRRLRNIRNCLVHLELLDPELLNML